MYLNLWASAKGNTKTSYLIICSPPTQQSAILFNRHGQPKNFFLLMLILAQARAVFLDRTFSRFLVMLNTFNWNYRKPTKGIARKHSERSRKLRGKKKFIRSI